MKQCCWTENSEGVWDTGCGNAFELNDGSPANNNMVWCCYCGEKLAQCSYQELAVDDDTDNAGAVK